jgi:hypothetical protein
VSAASDALFHADERTLLLDMLQLQRDGVLMKLDGVTHDDGVRRLVPSDTTILGVASHLAWVERWWFRSVVNGEVVQFPWTDENPDGDFEVGPADDGASISRLYREAIAGSDLILAGLDDLSAQAAPKHWTRGTPPSLRWIIVHMIQETARHAGHLDILREQIDGSTGMELPED